MFMSILLQAALGVSLSKSVAAIAASVVVIGAALGISRIASTALESIARQPEAAGDIRSSMILAAALIEGVAMFAILVSILVILL
ncbi:MAG: ATP synthase F0 subunit C [Bacteroidaceae bacterium]|nr:ATP synthase F0 subunit C [Bacteroidaceae bacterium]MBQ8364655.1 ATP synthase F0 subunit C [Bacteroidaceae bacterium]